MATFGASELLGNSVVVRELVPRGTLSEVLSRTLAEGEALPWEALQALATGIAHGLAYLHESRPPIPALLSSQKILVGENYQPKASREECPFLS